MGHRSCIALTFAEGIKKRLWRFIELLRREGHVDESNELKLGILRVSGLCIAIVLHG